MLVELQMEECQSHNKTLSEATITVKENSNRPLLEKILCAVHNFQKLPQDDCCGCDKVTKYELVK